MRVLLTKTSSLALLFAAAIALVFGFNLWTPSAGVTLLDGIGPALEAQELLASMSETQKTAHFRMTLWLDMLFPLAYGGFFAGMVLRNFEKPGVWLAIPAFLVIPIDIAENVIQLIALSGNESLLGAKSLLTPTKFALFNVAAVIAFASLMSSGIRLLLNTRKNRPNE